MSDVLEQLHDDLSNDLDRVKLRFKPGVKVTLVITKPGNPEADVVIGDADLNETIEAIRRRVRTSPHGTSPPCSNMSPAWFTGRWRDWHRGHGCDKDDGKPRTPEGQAEIEEHHVAALDLSMKAGRRG